MTRLGRGNSKPRRGEARVVFPRPWYNMYEPSRADFGALYNFSFTPLRGPIEDRGTRDLSARGFNINR